MLEAFDRHLLQQVGPMPSGTGWQGVYNPLLFLVRWLKCDEEKSRQTVISARKHAAFHAARAQAQPRARGCAAPGQRAPAAEKEQRAICRIKPPSITSEPARRRSDGVTGAPVTELEYKPSLPDRRTRRGLHGDMEAKLGWHRDDKSRPQDLGLGGGIFLFASERREKE